MFSFFCYMKYIKYYFRQSLGKNVLTPLLCGCRLLSLSVVVATLPLCFSIIKINIAYYFVGYIYYTEMYRTVLSYFMF